MLTEEQKHAHDAGMTGSKIARIITGKFGGGYQVYREMKHGYVPPMEFGRFLKIGNALEPVIVEDYADETQSVVVARSTIYHADDPWYRVHIDGEIQTGARPDSGVIEAKSANTAIANKDWSGEIPDYPIVQTFWGMFCTGYRWGVISVISGLYEITHHTIEWDQDIMDMIVEQAVEFRNRLKDDRPPEVDGSDVTTKVINRSFPTATLDMLTLDTSLARELAARLNHVKAVEKLVVSEKHRLENVFKLHLGEHAGAHIPMFGNITWKNTEPKKVTPVVNIGLLKEEFPDAYNKCVEWQPGTSHRRFLVQPDKAMVDPELTEQRAIEAVSRLEAGRDA